MAIFSDCSVVLNLKDIPFKEKRKLMNAILDNGGNISYVVNQKCSFVVASNLETISSSRLKSAQKHQIPVVSLQYIWSCLEKALLLPVQDHVLKPQSSELTPEQAPHPVLKSRDKPQPKNTGVHYKVELPLKYGTYMGRFRVYKENDHDIPEYSSAFQVAKYSILVKAHPNTWSVLELQSAKAQAGQQYRVVSSIIQEAKRSVVWDKQVHSQSSEDAVEAYLMLSKELQDQGFALTRTLPQWVEKLTSHSLQQLLLEEKLNCSTISQEVGVFVELIWTEALGSLSNILTVPVTSISLADVSRVEGLLLQAQKSQCEDEVNGLLQEVNSLLPVRITEPDSKNKLVSQKLDLCQLIRDILNMTEVTLGNTCPSSLGKYRALRCSIEQVASQSPEFLSVSQLLQDRPAQIQQVLRVSRGTELHMFRNELDNIKPLLHSTASSSLVGILSRGLLLPRVGVEQHGIERTDIGNLGSGIYFSGSLNTSVKYSKPSVTDGCRLLLVCDVALGQCKDLHKRDYTLTSAPEGYDSVHGVCRTQNKQSDFEDDEYVVYNTDQIRLKYVVQYILPEDEAKDFQPNVDLTPALPHFASPSHLLSSDEDEGLGVTKNPLENVTAGLLDSNGQTLPLQAVHVRCKLMDLLSQVIIFQTYTNNSIVPIEAKYVFPLEETAAVCGFEAFINGKHVIGKVKEKEQARKEYRQAIEKGHGAYLMDQDAPDVFTISVGNLPPGATVLIKVTFITELVVTAGSIVFSLPGSVAPWQQSSALNQRTQTTVEKVCVNELQSEREFSLCMSIEMPYEILNLECSHQIQIKRTDCKAVVSTSPDQTLSTDGFRLSFTLSQIHMPRMWVEKHPEKDTEACMLVFYPHFESSGFSVSDVSEVIIVLDTSESMRGDSMLNARKIALKVLHSLDRSIKVNIISFGSDYKEAFPSPVWLYEVFEEAKNFIMSSTAVGGSTELWRPLRTLNLLPPPHGVRNLLLISDGHVQNQPQTLQLVRNNVRHTRIFTCGLNLTANRYMLRALAQAGGGTYEFFDTKTKHTWAEKVNSQVRCMLSAGCNSVAVKWQQFNPTAPTPVQAPSQLHALFSDCHTLIYGFVPHCTQATLFGDIIGQEIETMVSTTELQKTKGTFLHKLTARAIIRDYENGSLATNEAEHEGKKAELKSYIIELSKEFSILSQFTSFVAIEERDQTQPDSGFTDIPKIIAEEDVDILSYMGWTNYEELRQESELDSCSSLEYEDHSYAVEEDDESMDVLCYMSPFPRRGKCRVMRMKMGCSESLEARLREFDLQSVPAPPDELCMPEASLVSASPDIWRTMSRKGRTNVPLHECNLSIPSTQKLNVDASSVSYKVTSFSPHVTDLAPTVFAPPPVPTSASFTATSQSTAFGASASFSSVGFGASPLPLVKKASVPHLGFSGPIPSVDLSASDPLPTSFGFRGHPPPPPPPPPPSVGVLSYCSLDAFTAPASSPPPPPPPPPPSVGVLSYYSLDAFTAPAPPPPPPPGYSIEFRRPAPFLHSSLRIEAQAPRPPGQAQAPLPCIAFSSGHPPSSYVFGASAAPPPAPSADFYVKAPAPPPPGPSADFCFGVPAPPPHGPTADFCLGAPVPSLPPPVDLSVRVPAPPIIADAPHVISDAPSGLVSKTGYYRSSPVAMNIKKRMARRSLRCIAVDHVERERHHTQTESLSEHYSRPDRIDWEELFNLQHQDGYWACTGTLSRFLGLDVDFFANVFLKEKGICSLGAKAHADILKLAATLLVLQLMRVMKMADGKLFQSLFRLTEHPEPRPACWEAVKRAVEWVCWADRQYPCVCSRLEFGWDWESCTRQLLGLDDPPPFSPLIPLLQRRIHLSVM